MSKTLISSDLQSKIRSMAKETGLSQEELLRNAVYYYLESVKPYFNLRQELKAWDRLSDEAWQKLDRSL